MGFSNHQKTEVWRQDHYQLVKKFLGGYDQPEHSSKLKKFAVLAHGALLGLYSTGKIDDEVYRHGYILLPGFIMGKGGTVEAL